VPKVIPPPEPKPTTPAQKDQKAESAETGTKQEAKAPQETAKEQPDEQKEVPENPSKEDQDPESSNKEDNDKTEVAEGEDPEASGEVAEKKKKKKKHRQSIKDPSQVPEGEEEGEDAIGRQASTHGKKKKKKKHGDKAGEEGDGDDKGQDDAAAEEGAAAEPSSTPPPATDEGESKPTETPSAEVPEFAAGWGFKAELPEQLKEYYTKNQLELPDYFQEPSRVWQKLMETKQTRDEMKKNLKGFSSNLNLFKGEDMVNQLQAAPGETLEVAVKGSVWSEDGDSKKQQVLLAMDNGKPVAEVYEGAASQGEDIEKSIEIKAPEEPGLHMLWRYTDTQDDMEKAKECLASSHGEAVKPRFPEEFVGLLLVSEP